MVTDAVRWVCRTPRRLATFAVCVMAVVLVGSSLLSHRGGSAGGAGGTGGAAPAVTVTAELPDATAFVTTAVRFVSVWSRLPAGTTKAQWQSSLAPLTTPDLEQALRTTDPADLPGSAPQGEPVVRYVAQSSALIAVPLADGSSVLVTVVTDGATQRVSDVQPYAGDG